MPTRIVAHHTLISKYQLFIRCVSCRAVVEDLNVVEGEPQRLQCTTRSKTPCKNVRASVTSSLFCCLFFVN